jgi:aspartyl-tRNA(Asn)/glutamyl-tRNA(Gln) amidotransferase subunit A
MTRTAVDAAAMLDALAGPDPADPSSMHDAAPDLLDALGGLDAEAPPDISGMRVGIPTGFDEGVDAEVAGAFRAATSTLEGLGAEVVDVRLPSASHSLVATFAIMCPEATLAHRARLRSSAEQYSTFARQTLLLGACLSATDYLRGQRIRHVLYRDVSTVLDSVDVLAWPTTRHTAPEVARPEGWAVVQTQLTNVTGHPSLTVPCGFTSEGLPMGLHLTGRMRDEAGILGVATAYQRATSWHAEAPTVPTDYEPPMTKPYAFGSLVGDVSQRERDALIDEVTGRLRNAGLPVFDQDVEPLAATLRSVKAGLDAALDDEVTIEPLVHQFIGDVPVA